MSMNEWLCSSKLVKSSKLRMSMNEWLSLTLLEVVVSKFFARSSDWLMDMSSILVMVKNCFLAVVFGLIDSG